MSPGRLRHYRRPDTLVLISCRAIPFPFMNRLAPSLHAFSESDFLDNFAIRGSSFLPHPLFVISAPFSSPLWQLRLSRAQ
jgi:hypothetical protein